MTVNPIEIREVGRIEEVKNGIIKISGLPNCIYGQMLETVSGLKGMVIEFNMHSSLGILFGDESSVKVGDAIHAAGASLRVPVGEEFIGRVVDSLCRPIDERKAEIHAVTSSPVFKMAAGVMEREPIADPLLTGIKIIDLAIPLGRGQRELIIGDRQIGKTSIAIDTILNQKGKDVICIYCWIGGSHAAFKKIVNLLKAKGAMEYTLAVCASAVSSAAEQYLCPYTAATLGEYFMYNGKNVLVVFDDLTKHAWIYRQISLLLDRSPGREAYPGDIFFLHSQLLERAGRLKAQLGGGTMTFLPIAETLQGDITGYIPSNLVSITDGQIYVNQSLFQEGFTPAIDLEMSVSRIGSKVQCPAIRNLSRGLLYTFVQYRSLQRLTRLRTKLSPETMQQLQRGRVLYELLTQENYAPLSLEEEIVTFYVFSSRVLEALDSEKTKLFKQHFFDYVRRKDPEVIHHIAKSQDLTADIKQRIDAVVSMFFSEVGMQPYQDNDTHSQA
jgi:F-type H+/Na+-transporting ATPase subunit alpha